MATPFPGSAPPAAHFQHHIGAETWHHIDGDLRPDGNVDNFAVVDAAIRQGDLLLAFSLETGISGLHRCLRTFADHLMQAWKFLKSAARGKCNAEATGNDLVRSLMRPNSSRYATIVRPMSGIVSV
jgi:hypothetical protein